MRDLLSHKASLFFSAIIASVLVSLFILASPASAATTGELKTVVISGDAEVMAACEEAESTLRTSADTVSQVVEALKAGVNSHQETVDISGIGASVEDAEIAIAQVLYDPEIYTLCARYSYRYYENSNQAVSVTLSYAVDTSSLRSWEVRAENKVAEALTWITSDMSEAQKAQALHDYLVRNCAYDYSTYNNTASNDKIGYTALGALVNGTAVCQGYSDAYSLLLSRAGIQSIYVGSDSMNHGWNMVKIGNSWYHVDVTWDDPTVKGSDEGFNADVRHKYFLKSDSSFQSLNHYGWSGRGTTCPSASSDYSMSYATYNGRLRSASCMYRLYNPWSGEHLFTLSVDEFTSLPLLGWRKEGVAWFAPQSGTTVYRLYNPYSGDHFYTSDRTEYNSLGALGWNQEGRGFYSASSGDTRVVKVYRLYNPWLTAGTHLFTTKITEVGMLYQAGWSPEGVAFYGV